MQSREEALSSNSFPPGPDAVARAARRIAGRVRRTPLLEIDERWLGSEPVTLKLEHLQVTGSFKPRGAFNSMLGAPLPRAGVVAASGGNHGLAVAYAAASLGVTAEIFIPEVTSPAKRAQLAATGAVVRVVPGAYPEALAAASARAAQTGARSIHAYDDPLVVAGQGTVALEIEEQVAPAGPVGTVVVAVGGGGLLAGVAAWFAGRCRVVAAEPESCPTLSASLAAGRIQEVEVGGIAVDSLGARRLGAIAFDLAVRAGVESVLVSDVEIREAQFAAWERLRLALEPGGAVALAALLSGRLEQGPVGRLVVVTCGANFDPGTLSGG